MLQFPVILLLEDIQATENRQEASFLLQSLQRVGYPRLSFASAEHLRHDAPHGILELLQQVCRLWVFLHLLHRLWSTSHDLVESSLQVYIAVT